MYRPRVQRFVSLIISRFQNINPKKEGKTVNGPADVKSELRMITVEEDHFSMWKEFIERHHRCRAPLLEECPQHHGHKGDLGVTPGTCGAIGERAQVILVWVRAPGRWERLPPTETRNHEG